jgi:hypothetical protein
MIDIKLKNSKMSDAKKNKESSLTLPPTDDE